MKGSKHSKVALWCAMLITAAVAVSGVYAAGPVSVAVAVTGDPVPGATVTAKATVTITDGSTLQSITWSQVSGPEAVLSNTNTDTITAVLPSRQVYKEELINILKEPPMGLGDEEEYFGGLQNRFVVVGSSPLSLEEAGHIGLSIVVVTTSGTYNLSGAIASALPWTPATGIHNVPVLIPVLLQGKEQAAYNWALTVPTGSTATLSDATGRNPEFTPDVTGTYVVTVTDTTVTPNAPVTITINAGLWRGVITGQNENGRPIADVNCRTCHAANTPMDQFTPWMNSGHAEVFSQNVNTTKNHYGPGCFSCHTVGYDPAAVNGGVDEAPDYAAFLTSGLYTPGDPDNWTKILAGYPATAKLANIQCENCHGPQNSPAHPALNGSRATLSSDLCGTCHGEPARHGRFQQWQLSGHANYELAREEGASGSCSKCHSAQGFLAWEETGWATNPTINVTWNTDTVHPQTCQTCHDPHAVGTTSGGPTTNATVRIMGTTPMLDAGFVASNVGRGALCITCHNGRRGLRDDAHYNPADASRAPHVGPQGDMLMGQNLYFATVGNPGYHSKIEDACVTCHMEATPPPADLSYNLGGTNHSFTASKAICSKCHSEITAEMVQEEVAGKMAALKTQIEQAIMASMQAQIKLGNTVTVGSNTTIKNAADITAVELTEASGRQAIIVTLASGAKTSATSLNNVKVVRPGGAPAIDIYQVTDPAVSKAGWNYFSVESDASEGVHNPAFINSALDVSLFAVKAVNAAGPTDPAVGGGPGTGVGAVSCTTPYVYWAEIAAHAPGSASSQWRTDLVARNLATETANLHFVLHQQGSNLEGSGTVAGGGQKSFEDIVAAMGGTNTKGSLEICSNQPLLVLGRNFNQGSTGTFGQFIDGHVANLGYVAGDTVSLIGLRQKVDEFRTNLMVTNGGTTDAEVAVVLYDEAGVKLGDFKLTVPAGKVAQDQEPFKNRAGKPDLGWGFATVTVLSGSNIMTSASVIDMKTNDPITVPGKQ